jgi:NADH-quinone oxidoreductase subunit C
MTPQEITDNIKTKFPDAIVEAKLDKVIDPFLKIAPAAVLDVSRYLHDEGGLGFDVLMCLSGVDNGKGMLGVVYHLFSMTHKHKIVLKVEVPATNAVVPSVESVWRTADWHEREAYDLIGITFSGHPDLRRMLLPDDWEGHPLRKDYKVPEFYRGMKVPS